MGILHEVLATLADRPTLFAGAGTAELWGDPHVQRQMLTHHLDPDTAAASREHAFIARSVDWLVDVLDVSADTRVLDLGCGPGLYANALAPVAGAVHGVDLSAAAIDTARQRASTPAPRFVVGDYLRAPLPEHDVALLIYCDYCALSPHDRGRLLDRLRRRMPAGARLLLDVHAAVAFDATEETCEVERVTGGGFWAPGDHVVVHQRLRYREARVWLDRFLVAEVDRTRWVHNWLAYLTPAELTAELARHGFVVEALHADVAGAPFDAAGPEFAVVARAA